MYFARVIIALRCVYISELFYWKDVVSFALNILCSGLFFGGKVMSDEEYMRLAMELAKKGCGLTSPNPMVEL